MPALHYGATLASELHKIVLNTSCGYQLAIVLNSRGSNIPGIYSYYTISMPVLHYGDARI